MSGKRKSQILAEKYKDVLILQSEGLFLVAYDESAGVLSDITGYKLVETESGLLRCSGPANKLEDMIRKIENARVSYMALKKDDVLSKQNFADNRFREYADREHLPYDTKKPIAVSEKEISVDTKPKASKEEVARYQNALKYTQRLCDGLNPITGKPEKMIDIENPNMMRYLFYIKSFLENNKIE